MLRNPAECALSGPGALWKRAECVRVTSLLRALGRIPQREAPGACALGAKPKRRRLPLRTRPDSRAPDLLTARTRRDSSTLAQLWGRSALSAHFCGQQGCRRRSKGPRPVVVRKFPRTTLPALTQLFNPVCHSCPNPPAAGGAGFLQSAIWVTIRKVYATCI